MPVGRQACRAVRVIDQDIQPMSTTANYHVILLVAVSLVAGTVAGCGENKVASEQPAFPTGRIVGGATKPITEDLQAVAGFLPEPALLQRGSSGQAAFVYINPATNSAAYDKILLDPVTIWAAPDSARK